MKKTESTVIENIVKRNENNLNGVAFESFGSKLTYKEFFELVDTLAKGFIELGVKNGDIVTMCMAGTIDSIAHFYALNRVGAVAQLVNPNYFKVNSKKYINETGSELLIVLDKFYPMLQDAIASTNIKKIMISSITEYASLLYKILVRRKKLKKEQLISGVEYITYPEFYKLGFKSRKEIVSPKYTEQKEAAVVFTSGSTGNPKGVVITNDALNNMISMYDIKDGFGARAGDRNLVLIPPMYGTSLCHCINTPLAFGCVNIMQPAYNPQTFLKDLMKYKPKLVAGSLAHYIGLLNKDIKDGSLSFLEMPIAGGEPVPTKLAMQINEKIRNAGAKGNLIIGYGMSEFSTMVTFNIDIENRTNESGTLLPFIKAKIVNPITNEPVGVNEKGIIKISTPCIMKGYLNNPEDTEKFFEVDEDGILWGNTGDIATVDAEGVYRVVGRGTDSFIDTNGNIIYLFDIENKIASNKYVKECELVSLTIGEKVVPVAHIVLEDFAKELSSEALLVINAECKEEFINPEAVPYAYKLRDKFPTSPISGKRDYETLKYETEDYLKITDEGITTISIVSEESKKDNEIEDVKKLKMSI
ncbi:MAG: acyl--CoA ligase [Lachnospiraceae bacterium]|nr:acyl--CoA ligase [Lachnospiraceae bacterium]